MNQELLNVDTIRSLNEMGALIGNKRYFSNIFRTFQDSFASDLDALDRFIEEGQVDQVRVIAHRMKSSAKTIGAEALGEKFAEVEAGIVHGNLELNELKSDMRPIRNLYRETMELFDPYLN